MNLAMQTNTSIEYYENLSLYELEKLIKIFNTIVEKQSKAN